MLTHNLVGFKDVLIRVGTLKHLHKSDIVTPKDLTQFFYVKKKIFLGFDRWTWTKFS